MELEVTLSHFWVVLPVPDHGPEKRAHIMESFFTSKPVGKSTGLGLSISRSIAMEYLGTLELNPESLHTCFLFSFKTSADGRSLTRPSKWN